MRLRLVMLAVLTSLARATWAQECELFDPCVAGICEDGDCIAGVLLSGNSCDDFNGCTTNDSCVNGECAGTPFIDRPCDDLNECTANDRCTNVGGDGVICRGTAPVDVGTRCASQCGTCQPIAAFPDALLICKPDAERLGSVCAPVGIESPCFVGTCTAPDGQIASCAPMLKPCPDTDGNPCTGEFCNFETGECDTSEFPLRQECFPIACHRCVPETGECVPINVGGSCDDFNECTASSICSPEGGCVPAPCVADCDQNGVVQVNELVIGVNIALDRADLAECLELDLNRSSAIEVNELVSGVNSLLHGCVAAASAGGRS